MSFIVTCYYFTNAGKGRENNEDSLLIDDFVVSDISMSKSEKKEFQGNRHFFCIADGIGGQKKGEEASNEVLSFLLRNIWTNGDLSNLSDLITRAKFYLNDLVAKNPDLINFGATIAGVGIVDTNLIILNSGDSRVYRLNEVFFERITRDHSIVEELFSEGLIKEDEMRVHPQKNVITSAIIGDGSEDSPNVNVRIFPIRHEDVLFICTDGIWESLPINYIEQIYIENGFDNFADAILSACLSGKSPDNISLIGLRISENEVTV